MSLGLNHATYGPDIKLQYANPLASHNPKNFGSNQGIIRGFTGPINSQQAASSSAPRVTPKIVCGPMNQRGGTQTRLVHGSSAYGMALNPGTYEQQVPYSSMYAPIVPRGVDNTQRTSGMGAGRTLLPGNLNNYEKPKLRGGGNNRMTLPIPSGSKYFTTKIENGMDYSIYAGSGYPPVKGNLSHGDCSRKVLIGGKGCKSKKHRIHRKGKNGGSSGINFNNQIQGANQYGGFIIDPPIAKCNSQLDNAIWLNNHNMRRKNGGLGPKKTVTLKEASGRTAYSKFFRFANQQNGGQGRMSTIRSFRGSRGSRRDSQKYGGKNKSKKSRKQKRSRKNQKGGVLGGLSGNPLWKNEYQLSYPPNEINPWPPVRNIRPF